MRVEAALTVLLSVSALAFAAPVWRHGYLETLLAHCVFEFTVGMCVPSPIRADRAADPMAATLRACAACIAAVHHVERRGTHGHGARAGTGLR
jgi:hypothetical protein